MTRVAVVSIVVLLLTLNLVTAQQPTPVVMDQGGADRLLATAKQRWAPDRRTVVFDVTATVAKDGIKLAGEVHDGGLKKQLIAMFAESTGQVILDELRALPDPTLSGRTFGVVCVSVANLRSRPGHSQELGTQVLLGTPLRLLKKVGGWYYVQAPNDYLCWTNDRMQLMDKAAFASWRKLDKVMITDTFTVVHRQPSNDSLPISDAVAGSMLALVDTQNGFCHVRYADGREGYVSTSSCQPLARWLKDADDQPARLVATARRFFGVPYLWGGTSTKGMDCSGFTSTVWLLNGVLLPRDASQQVHAGIEVTFDASMSQVRAGDLLFFGRRTTVDRSERVTHVGISLGRYRFIHSSTDVHENSFDPTDADYSESLKRSLLHVRRVIDQDASTSVRPLREHPLYRLR